MSTDPVLFELNDGVARVTLNRPRHGNAINTAMAQTLVDVAIRCDTDAAIRCVLLTGTGSIFCAGGDIGMFAAAGEKAPALLGELAALVHFAEARLVRMRKPLVVLVNGPAAGAGMSLALLGDVVIAVHSAHFTAAYGALGLTPDAGMSWLLPRLVGLRRAQDILMTNRRVAADEALAIGMITRLVADDKLAGEMRVAADLADGSTFALGGIRALLADSFSTVLEAQLEHEARSIVTASGNPESRERITAFLERRKPQFQGE
jgi:2-(1,2-epoxy-1,2-dihydrophenyl)acetyl-CoA isomerase